MIRCILLLLRFIQFVGIMHGARLVATSFRYRFCAFHHQCATEGAIYFLVRTEIAGRLCFDRILAVRIIGTAVENTKATFAFGHKTFFANRAGDPRVVP